MENLPIYVPVVFIATLLLGIWLFLKATGYALSVILLLGAWIVLQSTLGALGFYNAPGRLTARSR